MHSVRSSLVIALVGALLASVVGPPVAIGAEPPADPKAESPEAFASAAVAGATITTPGPLERITITPDLNCSVQHRDDTVPAFYGDTACATLVAVGSVLYGPADIPAGGSASPRTSFTPVNQTMAGAGTPTDPYRITTVVDAGASGLRLTPGGEDFYALGDGMTTSRTSPVQVTGVSGTASMAGGAFFSLQANGGGT